MTSPAVEPAEPTELPELPPRRPMKAVWFFVPYTLLLFALAAAVILNAEKLGLKRSRTAEPPAAAAPVAASSDAQLRARIAELEAQLAAARAGAPGATLTDATAQALSERLTRLEEGQGRAVRAAAAAVAAGALADAAEDSGPFAAELATLERLVPDSPTLARLRPLAETGAPTRAALTAEFPTVAARAAAASRVSPEGGSFLDRAAAALNSIITIRRVDDLTGSKADAVLARAERRVADGDLEGALAELAALPPSGRKAVAPWVEKARRRVEIEERIAALRTDALRDLAARAGGPA